jgi:hypothetical protein
MQRTTYTNNNKTNNNNNKKQQNDKMFFCKICKDAGKTETEYLSHNPRDLKGNTICSTILAQQCRYCKSYGHTVKYCPNTKPHYSETQTTQTTQTKQTPVKKTPVVKAKTNSLPANIYSCLLDDEEIAIATPNTTSIASISIKPTKLSFADIIKSGSSSTSTSTSLRTTANTTVKYSNTLPYVPHVTKTKFTNWDLPDDYDTDEDDN